MLLETMLNLVQVLKSTTEIQHVSASGKFALDFAWLVILAINTSRQCPKAVTYNVVMHLVQRNRMASITFAKLSMEDLVASTRRSIMCEEWFFFRLNTNLNNYSASAAVLKDFLSRQNGESMEQYVSRR